MHSCAVLEAVKSKINTLGGLIPTEAQEGRIHFMLVGGHFYLASSLYMYLSHVPKGQWSSLTLDYCQHHSHIHWYLKISKSNCCITESK